MGQNRGAIRAMVTVLWMSPDWGIRCFDLWEICVVSGDLELNVVSLQARSRDRQLAPLHEVERYWHSLIRDGDLPMRGDIDPRAIQNTLEYAFVGERVTDGMAKLRVAGAHLSDLLGMAVTGLPLGALFTQKARPHLAEATRRVFTAPAIVRMELTTPASVWAQRMKGDLILLPMRSDMGDVSRVLGCLVTRGEITRTPRRFDIARIRLQPIRSEADLAAPVVHDDAPAPAPVPTHAPRPVARGPHLRLVVRND